MDLSTDFNAESAQASIDGAERQVAEMTKLIEHFETKYGPFSDVRPAAEGPLLPVRPLFLVDFALRRKMLLEFIHETRGAMLKKPENRNDAI